MLCSRENRKEWTPAAQELPKRFKVEYPDSPELNEFKTYMTGFEARAQAEAQIKFDTAFPTLGNDGTDEKRTLSLAALLGLDLGNSAARAFAEWVSLDLPDGRAFAALGMQGATSAKVTGLLETRLAVGREKIEQLALDPSLAPATVTFSRVLEQLREMK
jgi:hypothetical protein